KGKIDVELAQKFLSDHFDSFDKKEQPDERSLCGHVDASARGVKEWAWDAHNPGGAVQGKATDSKMAASMSFVARAGHPCGAGFPRTASRVFLAKVAPAQHESRPVDQVPRRSEGQPIRLTWRQPSRLSR